MKKPHSIATQSLGALLATVLLCYMAFTRAAISAEVDFGYHTIDYPASLLRAWTPKHPFDLRGRYSSEYGDGGGSIEIIGYPIQDDEASPIRYSIIIIGPASVASKPKITVAEDLKLVGSVLRFGSREIRLREFTHLESKKTIRGLVLEGLFYEIHSTQ
jgi:hypothetical protein